MSIKHTFMQVCIPGLHISLGIFNRLWVLLEDACSELDLLLAQYSSGSSSGSTFEQYSSALKEEQQLKSALQLEVNKATMLEQLVTYITIHTPSASTDMTTLRHEASKARMSVAGMV